MGRTGLEEDLVHKTAQASELDQHVAQQLDEGDKVAARNEAEVGVEQGRVRIRLCSSVDLLLLDQDAELIAQSVDLAELRDVRWPALQLGAPDRECSTWTGA